MFVRLLVCSILLAALPATARVALAVQLTGENPVHRDFVAGVADDARARFALLPPLKAEVVEGCKGSDKCLRRAAQGQGATHLIIVGVSELGESDFVVVLRVINLESGAELANYNDLATPGKDPRVEGTRIATSTFEKKEISELPAKGSVPDRKDLVVPDPKDLEPEIVTEEVPYSGLSPVSAVGWAVTGVGAAVVAVVGGAAGASFLAEDLPSKHAALENSMNVLPIALGVTLVGLLTVAVDGVLPHIDLVN